MARPFSKTFPQKFSTVVNGSQISNILTTRIKPWGSAAPTVSNSSNGKKTFRTIFSESPSRENVYRLYTEKQVVWMCHMSLVHVYNGREWTYSKGFRKSGRTGHTATGHLKLSSPTPSPPQKHLLHGASFDRGDHQNNVLLQPLSRSSLCNLILYPFDQIFFSLLVYQGLMTVLTF